MAAKLDPDEIWDSLSSKEARLTGLEEKIEEAVSSGGLGACARPSDADGESLKDTVERLERWVREMYEWAITEDTRNRERD